jgi:SAM-dependent methyltransferase
MLIRFFRQPQIDPLQVSMTGVRMGERFVLVGCDDPVLLAGLGAKVGLSGGAAVVAFDEHQAVRARSAASREGVLLDMKIAADGAVGFPDASFDMAVVDDTGGGFASRDAGVRGHVLAELRRVLRPGGRIEVVEGLGSSGMFARPTARPGGYDSVQELDAAGFRPVRVLAELPNFRFVEGLSPNASIRTLGAPPTPP